MTRESRHFIGIKEILGIEYDCPKCHVRVWHALDNVPVFDPFKCKGCGAEVLDESDGEYMKQLAQTIKHLQSRGESVNVCRLQIIGESA